MSTPVAPPTSNGNLLRGLIIGGVTLLVLIVAGAVITAIAIGNAVGAAADRVEQGSIAPVNMASDGVVFVAGDDRPEVVESVARSLDEPPVPVDTSGFGTTAHIEVYVDYMCPICGAFDLSHGSTLEGWIDQGLATVEIHPIAILDRVSQGSEYSTRAANAMACVAQTAPGAAWAVNEALFDAQPDEYTPGLDDAELLAVLASAGAESDELTRCVEERSFGAWVLAATERVSRDGVPTAAGTSEFMGTPTVVVNGVVYPMTQAGLTDPSQLADFINSLVAAT